MSYLISKFIDNELDIDDKIRFVGCVYEDRDFKNEAIDLLGVEKIVRADVVGRIPPLKLKPKNKWFFRGLRPLGFLTSATAVALLLFFILHSPVENTAASHRFVIYRPDVIKAEIVGTFTGWQRIPMERIGSSGYWETTLNLPYGEHQFTYMLDNETRFTDPTVRSRELDDFGGQNSIITIESRS